MGIYQGVIAVVTDLPGPEGIIDILGYVKSEIESSVSYCSLSTVQDVVTGIKTPYRIIIIGKGFHPLLFVKDQWVYLAIKTVHKSSILTLQVSRNSNPLKC